MNEMTVKGTRDGTTKRTDDKDTGPSWSLPGA